jgi:hypothetical protein
MKKMGKKTPTDASAQRATAQSHRIRGNPELPSIARILPQSNPECN